jgi:signal transduction histidine kinase
MFKIFRRFSVVSFVCVAAAAILIGMFYRYTAIDGIVRLAETNNVALARSQLRLVEDHVVEYLVATVETPSSATFRPEAIRSMVDDLMQDASIMRIKMYNLSGRLVYSTGQKDEIHSESDDEGVRAALRGEVVSRLFYRDRFNIFDRVTANDNVIETYIPVRGRGGIGEIVGAFEIYRDGSASVREIESAELAVLGGAILILAALYLALLTVVSRTERIIEVQAQALIDRANTLAALGGKMLTRQVAERKAISQGLHEGVAQTLNAVRLSVATAASDKRGVAGEAPASAMSNLVPVLEQAIDDVVATALKLHPPSLDELGLLPTLDWLCREVTAKHPNVRLTRAAGDVEQAIPARLKPIIYRVIEQTLWKLAGANDARRIQVELEASPTGVALTLIDEQTVVPMSAGADEPDQAPDFSVIREYVVISGGEFELAQPPHRPRVVTARWPEAA